MDATVLPNQLDYAGPVGVANVQQAQARLVPFPSTAEPEPAARVGPRMELAIEAPDPQITMPMRPRGPGIPVGPI